MRRSALPLCFLLGAWCAGTLFMWQTAIQNFAVAASVQASRDEGFREAAGAVSDDGLRLVLRHQASEVNRLFFRGWGWAQLPLGMLAVLLAWRGGGGWRVTGATGTMLAVSVVLTLYVVPETVRLGRMMDFAAESALPEVRSAFWTLHHAYTGLDALKLLLGLASAIVVWRLPGPSRPVT